MLLVPAPSIGAACAMVWMPDTTIGQAVYLFSKIWLFALPVLWHVFVSREKCSLSPMRRGGLGFGLASGVAISVAIFAVYWLLGDHLIDVATMREKITEIGLAKPWIYVGAAAYWILVNSVLEEYVWRWFVVRRCETLFRGPGTAATASAIFFTLHHVVALSVYMDPMAVTVCSTGVFLGGLIWSWMYTHYRSIWPGYLSHAIVDLCIFSIGAHVVFG